MNDRAVALLEQYDIEVLHTRKGRGAILCDTGDGCLILKEYTGNGDRLNMQDKLLKHIKSNGSIEAEMIIPTKEGELSVKDVDGSVYILKTYCEGRECNIRDREECIEAVGYLAGFHKVTMNASGEKELPGFFALEKEFEKRNRELRHVKKFLVQRSQKTDFEISLLNTYDRFMEQAFCVSEEWRGYHFDTDACSRIFCHGDYQYHNIIKSEKGWFLINFEKCVPDQGVRDLYLLMRKLLEKTGWSVDLGRALMEAYKSRRPIPAAEYINLYYRLAYPEKFWKIVNFYYNSKKSWIPDKNREKLEKLILQETDKQHFLDEVFRDVRGL